MFRKRIRRARSDLLWGLSAFALLQVGLAVAIETGLPQLRDSFFVEKLARLTERRNAVTTHPLTVVMLGSSRTLHGFKAGSIEELLAEEQSQPVVCFNFGMYGAGPVTELLTLKRLLAQGTRPDWLLVEIVPPLLAKQVPLHEVEEKRIPTHRLWLNDLPLIERYSPSRRQGLRREWWEAWPVPWYTHRFAILSRIAPVLVPWDVRVDGFQGVDRSGYLQANWETLPLERRRRALEFARQEYAPYLTDFGLGGAACQGLQELLAVCQQERIRAALVLMPEGPEFRRWYPPGIWEQIQAYLDGLSREWEVPIINAREWLAEDDFLDSHHMLVSGATRFSERLGREALRPLLCEGSGSSSRWIAARGPRPNHSSH
jgi:hypothetical protein